MGYVTARDAVRREGTVEVFVAGGAHEVEVTTLVPREQGGLVFEVTHEGQPVVCAAVALRRAGSYATLPMAAGLAADGTWRAAVPPGVYPVIASAPDRGVGVVEATVRADEPRQVEVVLEAARTLVVSVVRKDDGTPVSGVVVGVREPTGVSGPGAGNVVLDHVSGPPTDAMGRTVITGLPLLGPIVLTVRDPGFDGSAADDSAVQRFVPSDAPDGFEVKFHLVPLIAGRWPLVPGDVAPPPSGTVLGVEGDPGAIGATLPATVRVEGDFLVGEGFSTGPIHAYAVAPDGSIARLFRVGTGDGAPTSFTPPPTLELEILDADGRPEVGSTVELFGAFGAPWDEPPRHRRSPTRPVGRPWV